MYLTGLFQSEELATVLQWLGAFFRAIASDAPEHIQLHQGSTQLAAVLLDALHQRGLLASESAVSMKQNESCALLIKDVLYGCGTAANHLLAALLPVVLTMLRCHPSAAVFAVIGQVSFILLMMIVRVIFRASLCCSC